MRQNLSWKKLSITFVILRLLLPNRSRRLMQLLVLLKRTQSALSGNCKRRALILGMGALALNPLQASPLLAEGMPEKYDIFVDKVDGYSYYYPSDWRDFDFTGHDSAFKDRSLQLQNVRLSFIPTSKTDIRDLGPMDEVVFHLVNDVYSTPNQVADIYIGHARGSWR